MTNHPALFSSASVSEQPKLALNKEALESLAAVAVLVGAAYVALTSWTEEVERKAQNAYVRGERLAAYKARHKWKSSDVRPLLSIGVSDAAQRRMARLKGKGRPMVKPHRQIEDWLRDKLTNWLALFRNDLTASERRRLFRHWPWWKHHVEALYRGELERARANGTKGPSDHAERAVAEALRVSQATVHAVCVEIRALRRDDAESANFPPMVLAEFEAWMDRGELPERLSGG